MNETLILQSKDRISDSTSSANFVLNLQKPTRKGDYSLEYAYLPNSVYNIDATNDQVYFTDSGARVGTLEHGYYDSSNVASLLQTAMNSASSGYTVTLSTTNSKLTVSKSSGTFYFTFGTNSTNTCSKELGFNNTDQSAGATQTAENPIQLSRHLVFHIDINHQDTYLTSLESGTVGYTFYIPVMVNSQDFIEYRGKDLPTQILKLTDDVKRFNIKLYDDSNRIIDLQKQDWYFVLKKV